MKNEPSDFQTIYQHIREARGVLLINPFRPRPDGDSFGSSLALARHLKNIGKPHWIFSRERPESFYFLPGFHDIVSLPEELPLSSVDLVMTFDFSELKMSGLAEHLAAAQHITVVKIDHHPASEHFGHINVVDTEAASVTEIIYRFFRDLKLPIDKHIATCLLCGIITDTASFTNLNTTSETIAIASRLLTYGARLKEIIKHTTREKSLGALKLWGLALGRLNRNSDYNLVTTVITRDDCRRLQVDENATDGLANFLNSLGEAKASLVLCEEKDGTIKGSLRTTAPDVDVSRLAQVFNGGGHKKAAGFSLKGKFVKNKKGWQII